MVLHMKAMSPEEIHEAMKNILGGECPYSIVKNWTAEFRQEKTITEDEHWSSHPTES